MPTRTSKTGSELFIVDNSDEAWKVLRYLQDWCPLSKSIDVATGYFDIGSLLALKEEWQKVDGIRILMGDEVSQRTKIAFTKAFERVKAQLDDSLESEKLKNDFLAGVPAIVEAIRSGKIKCRVYRKEKFHAKAYITHARQEVVGSFALVGSSNLTYPGITENIELNVRFGGAEVGVLQEWYEEHWEQAEEVTAEILQVIERHVRDYSPFEVYAKSMQEFFRGHEMTVSEWERNASEIYPILAPYQREGYHGLLKRAQSSNGAFLCDAVGLGKTFVGLMLIERLVLHDRKNVALFVPKSARKPVWEAALRKYLPKLFGKFTNLEIFNHTDLSCGGEFPQYFESVRERAHVIIIDEAHHFRNTGTKGETDEERKSRYWRLFDLAEGKQIFLLTATPVNNKLTDLQHTIELFSRRQADYFKDAPLGIHSLPGHFRKMEKELERLIDCRENPPEDLHETNLAEAERVLKQDELFRALVVQRSRAYVYRSESLGDGGTVKFPKRGDPQVVPYSVKQTYGKLLTMVEEAFSKKDPLFALSIYYPYAYYKGDQEVPAFEKGRKKQVVRLIRTSFLKRFESSVESFTMSCWMLMRKLLAWLQIHAETENEKHQVQRWMLRHKKLTGYVLERQSELFGDDSEDEAEEDIVPEEMLEAVEKLSRDEFDIEAIIGETLQDLEQIAIFLNELKDFKPSQDKKLRELIKLLRSDGVLKRQKVIIFTEFMTTARYLKNELMDAGISGVAEIDSASAADRGEIIRRFAPYYNDSSSAQLAERGLEEIRVLISTDVLSEGLNLQDATRLINYDLHWNPVRLMQRIGRIDRRLNPDIEARIVADHPDQAQFRGEIAYWNFLPPDDLNDLLELYQKVSKKTLRISKTFGIEGKKLLKPDDDYEDLRDFYDVYEGSLSADEDMHLEYQQLLKDHPGLERQLGGLPNRIFSGKEHPQSAARAVFFCYARPGRVGVQGGNPDEGAWSVEAGDAQWYLFDLATEKILEDACEIRNYIRSTPETPRRCLIERETLSDIRAQVDKHIKNTYLKKVQAPLGVKPILKAWMELN
ncbi:MAG: DEAD/DEAH box helicase family protein [Pirellulales bacterium]|nr:DEAD/DEAH box helicase family protein [Pirellulales bacterium]